MLKKIGVFVLLFVPALSGTFAQSSEKVVEEIKKMDRQWQVESYSSRDLKDYDRIVAEDFLITGSNGKILTKAEKKANVKADYTEFSPDAVFKIDEASHKVRLLDDDVAVSTGYIIEKYVYQGTRIDARVHFTCTYLKRKGAWQVAAAHYTRIKQQ
ncbi:MAG TPA: nuclear transport factor 2 family protein [Pyrinomonadaceae bacterium]|jgi:hypothetical protein